MEYDFTSHSHDQRDTPLICKDLMAARQDENDKISDVSLNAAQKIISDHLLKEKNEIAIKKSIFRIFDYLQNGNRHQYRKFTKLFDEMRRVWLCFVAKQPLSCAFCDELDEHTEIRNHGDFHF